MTAEGGIGAAMDDDLGQTDLVVVPSTAAVALDGSDDEVVLVEYSFDRSANSDCEVGRRCFFRVSNLDDAPCLAAAARGHGAAVVAVNT